MMTYSGVNGKSIALLGWWVRALAIAVGSGMGVNPAIAQLIPDDTLGSEGSIVMPLDALNDRIDGGAIRGSNLFHSFGEFNIDAGRGAFFRNPAVIENILTRVTGGNPSEIFGTLGVLGEANLFLVNPTGIVFGPDARLDVGGSFFASTAGGILFRDGYEFSATNPDASGAGTGAPPLLTVNVPIGLQFGANPGGIVNQSVATNDVGEVRGLSVPSGETLALVGGNVTLDGGSVQPRGGRVELGGLAGVGTVGVNADGSLSFPEGVERADVSLSNEAEVNVRAGGGGEIAIHARNFQMSDLSKLRGGIDDGMGAPDAQAGDIDIDATGTVALFDGSFVSNTVRETATGNGGDVNVTSQTLSLTGNAERFSELNTLNEGQGNAGVVTVRTADAITLDGGAIASDIQEGIGNVGGVDIEARSLEMVNASEVSSTISGSGNSGSVKIQVADSITLDASNIFNGTFEGGVGEAEDIEITSGSLLLSNGALISSSSGGIGNSGGITIQVRDSISLDFSDIVSQIVTNGVGNAGEIDITTGSLFLTNGSQVGSGTFGRGDGGNIIVSAKDTISIDGSVMNPDGTVFFSGITGSVAQGAIGNGGNVEIRADSVLLSNEGFIGSGTAGQGDGGTVSIFADTVRFNSGSNLENQVFATGVGNSGGIEIVAGSVFLNDESFLASTTLGQGNAGKIEISATDTVTVDNSSIFSRVREGAVGNAGDLDITTRLFLLSNGGLIDAATFGEGNAGNIVISAIDTVSADGSVIIPDGTVFFSQILSSVGEDAMGNSGSIEISANSVSLSNGAFLSASTSGQGDAGKIAINAQTVTLNNGSNIQSQVFDTGIGNSRGVEIVTDSLRVNNGASLATNTLGEGNAGKIEIQAADTVVFDFAAPLTDLDRSRISAQVGENAVGNSQGIDISTESLVLRNAVLGSSTLGRGDAGQITVRATEIVADNTIVSSFIGDEAIGNSQGIEIATGSLSFSNSLGGIGTFTAGEGNAGNVSIRAMDSVFLDNASILSSVISSGMEEGTGGDISITARTLSLNDAGLLASTLGQGDAGNVSLRIADSVTITGSIGIATDVLDEGIGRGGEIDIETGDFFLGDGTSLLAISDARGDAGQVRIRARNSVTLDGGSISTSVSPNAVGNAQGIEITTNRLSLSNGASIDAISAGDGSAGQIEVDANRIRLDASSISALTFGGEGNITLNSQEFILRNNSKIDTDAFGIVTGGNIEINSDVIAALENSDISANAQEAFGGRVTIDTQGLFGTAFRDTQTLQSDITATSALGPDFSGTVAITPPEIDPASGLVALPESPVDAASLLGKDFCSQRGNSEFIITGRGGLPPDPRDILPGSSIVEIDWVEFPDETASAVESLPTGDRTSTQTPPENQPLIEAQGWIADEAGNIILTAQPYRGTPYPAALRQIECQDGDRLGNAEEAGGE